MLIILIAQPVDAFCTFDLRVLVLSKEISRFHHGLCMVVCVTQGHNAGFKNISIIKNINTKFYNNIVPFM